jgi:hypothetical protein
VVKEVAPNEAFVDTVAQHVRNALAGLAESYAESGRSLGELGSPQQIAKRMVATVPSPSAWDDLLGPFYSTSKITRLLGNVSRQAITDRRKRRTLLGLRTADGAIVYPVFQFNEHNEVLPGLALILQCFDPEVVDDWTVAGWLVAPQGSLDRASVMEWVAAGRPIETVVHLAQAQAARYAQ